MLRSKVDRALGSIAGVLADLARDGRPRMGSGRAAAMMAESNLVYTDVRSL